MVSSLFNNAICGTKYQLKNGEYAFFINTTTHTMSHTGGYLLAYNGHLYEYDSTGKLMYFEEVHVDYLAELQNADIMRRYSDLQIDKRID